MKRISARATAIGIAWLAVVGWYPVLAQEDAPRPVFRSAVDLVSVAAVVKDSHGRLVRNLSADDFVVVDGGVLRKIVDFTAGSSAAVTIGILVDESGSMRVGPSASRARQGVEQFLSVLVASQQPEDAIALYGFDTRVHELQEFTSDVSKVRAALDVLEPFGSTSIYDAIAETAKQVAARGWVRRAVVVVTDGMDNRSRLSLEQASGIASAIDVPVYVVDVGAPAVVRDAQPKLPVPPTATFEDLARWTGGEYVPVGTSDVHSRVASARIVSDVRYQYLLAFESAPIAGWRPLQIRTRDAANTVRARGAYMAGGARPDANQPELYLSPAFFTPQARRGSGR